MRLPDSNLFYSSNTSTMVIREEILSNLLGSGILNAFLQDFQSSILKTKTLFTPIPVDVMYICLNDND